MGYLETALFELRRTKRLGDGALAQLEREEDWRFRPDPEANSVAVLVQHLHGNMRSRWTDFLTSDGEKETRKRDAEFEPQHHSIETLRELWEAGWACCLGAIEALEPSDVEKTVTIRGEPLTVMEAIQRQISHYAYHVGQIVLLARHRRGREWRSLTIPRGQSSRFSRGTYKADR